MGRYVFKLPDVGEGTAEAELVAWHVKVGDTVAEDQIIADIMTDKATVELTSPVAGKVLAAHGEPGQQLAVGSPLVEFEVEGAGNAAEAPPPSNPAPQASVPLTGGQTEAAAAVSTMTRILVSANRSWAAFSSVVSSVPTT
ncbi:MAG: biotin/lipoyl-containing protein [Brevundimonas sp.]|nr:biotin/lipoyl-containing protein [Brevundimonas sp.]